VGEGWEGGGYAQDNKSELDMRILIINRYSVTQTQGGVAEFLHYLPLSLQSLGVETFIYNEGKGDSLQGPELLPSGMQAYTGPFIKPGFFVSSKKLQPLIDLCRTQKIDLIHAQGTYRCGFIALQLFKRTGIPYVITSHADIATSNSARMRRARTQRRCSKILQHAWHVTHLTPLMAEVSHKTHDTRGKSTIIGNGIDAQHYRKYLHLPEQNYILAIGRFEKEKGFDVLISAYAELRKMGCNTSLVIAGSGFQEAALHEQAKQTGLNVLTDFQQIDQIPENSIVFTGYIRGEAKQRLIAQSKLFLFSTQPQILEEAFGIVQLEAMAAGKYLIASDSATTRFLQGFGLEAGLVQADNPLAWARKICDVLADDDLRLRIGKVNLEQAAQFDWPIVARQYRDMYLSIRKA